MSTDETTSEVQDPTTTEETPQEDVEKHFEEQEAKEKAGLVQYKKVKSEDIILKGKRKYHPNDEKYNNQESTRDSMVAEIKFMSTFTDEQSTLFSKGKLIATPEKTDEFWNTVQKDDILGFRGNAYKVVDKTKATIGLNKKKPMRYRSDEPTFLETKEKITKYEVDYALNIDFCEILYRDGKPYGLPEDMEYKVKVNIYENEKGESIITNSQGKKM